MVKYIIVLFLRIRTLYSDYLKTFVGDTLQLQEIYRFFLKRDLEQHANSTELEELLRIMVILYK